MSSKKDKDEIVQAAVVTTQEIIETVGKNLNNFFLSFNVSLLNISPADFYGPDAITLNLLGREKDIKKSLSELRKICNKKELGLETSPIKSLPPNLKRYLNDMENKERFERLFSFCADDYLKHCIENHLNPHPEVIEQYIENNLFNGL